MMALACPEGWEDVYVETAEAMEALRASGRLAFGQVRCRRARAGQQRAHAPRTVVFAYVTATLPEH